MKAPSDSSQEIHHYKPQLNHAQLVRIAWCGALSEVLFTVLPLLIHSMVLGFQDRLTDLFISPEWSFAASVLFGQSIVRLVVALAEKGGVRAERVGLAVTILLVLGLCPSLATLLLVMLSQTPGWILCFSQLVLCALGVASLFAASAFTALSRGRVIEGTI